MASSLCKNGEGLPPDLYGSDHRRGQRESVPYYCGSPLDLTKGPLDEIRGPNHLPQSCLSPLKLFTLQTFPLLRRKLHMIERKQILNPGL